MSTETLSAGVVLTWIAERAADLENARAVLSLAIAALNDAHGNPKQSVHAMAALYGCKSLLDAIDEHVAEATSATFLPQVQS